MQEAGANDRLRLAIADLHRTFPRNLTWSALRENVRLLQENIEQHQRIRERSWTAAPSELVVKCGITFDARVSLSATGSNGKPHPQRHPDDPARTGSDSLTAAPRAQLDNRTRECDDLLDPILYKSYPEGCGAKGGTHGPGKLETPR